MGPVELPDGSISKNVENAWQYSKVYREYLDDNGDPSKEYFIWAKEGFDNQKVKKKNNIFWKLIKIKNSLSDFQW